MSNVFSIRLDDDTVNKLNECKDLVMKLQHLKVGNSTLISAAISTYLSDLRYFDAQGYTSYPHLVGDVGTRND